MSKKTVRCQQQALRFSVAEPAVCPRIEIHIELERVAADERNDAGWIGHLRWRAGASHDELLQRLCQFLAEWCVPQCVGSDNASGSQNRRPRVEGDGRG